ncbi:hypothetical protein [Proteus phage vB_PmiP_RS51pmB]|nr:hypothetical protein [Proteus phage vB_PmiP_RS51pmB]
MKTITYRGEQYEVEDWVNWVAMDAGGEIYAYEHEPIVSSENDWINTGGNCFWIGSEPQDWDESLEKV